jgi:hypothetical protein
LEALAQNLADSFKFLERPSHESTKQIGLDQDTSPPGPTTLKCNRYKKFAIIEVNKPSLKGASLIQIRTTPSEKNNNQICQPNYNGEKKNIDLIESYFVGVAGTHAYLAGADSFGLATRVSLVDVKTSLIFYEDEMLLSKGVTRHLKKDAVELSYYKVLNGPLSQDCLKAANQDRCWKEYLTKQNLPLSNPLLAQRCKITAKLGDDKRTWQVAVPVIVKIGKRAIQEFIDGPAECEMTP